MGVRPDEPGNRLKSVQLSGGSSMTALNSYRIVRIPHNLQDDSHSPILCACPDGAPFPEGPAFYAWVTGENACVAGTGWNYLTQVNKVLTYFWHASPRLLYSAPAQEIRDRVRDYLKA